MPPSISAAAAAAAAVLLAHPAAAFPWYIPFNPNAEGVKGVASIGHINPAGGGANNAYGLAFAANGHVRRRARAGRRGGQADARACAEASAASSRTSTRRRRERASRAATLRSPPVRSPPHSFGAA
jgi:hypothetical protein